MAHLLLADDVLACAGHPGLLAAGIARELCASEPVGKVRERRVDVTVSAFVERFVQKLSKSFVRTLHAAQARGRARERGPRVECKATAASPEIEPTAGRVEAPQQAHHPHYVRFRFG